MGKYSIIWSPSKKEFQYLIDKSNSLSDVLRHFGFQPYSSAHRTLKQRIKDEEVNLEQLEKNRKEFMKKHHQELKNGRTTSDKEIFSENSNYCRQSLKKKIIKENLIEYKCKECGIEDEWNGKSISLQLDHINGINNDHRLENLRFLCPNCHSQTETYGTKRFKKRTTKCEECGTKVNLNKTSKLCQSCYINKRNETSYKKKFDPTKEELVNKIKELNGNIVKTGKFYGVSDNAIRNRCKKMRINWKVLKAGNRI